MTFFDPEFESLNFSSCIQEHTKIHAESCFEEVACEIAALINAHIEEELNARKTTSLLLRRNSSFGDGRQALKQFLCEHALYRSLNILGVSNYYKSYIFYTLNFLYNEN